MPSLLTTAVTLLVTLTCASSYAYDGARKLDETMVFSSHSNPASSSANAKLVGVCYNSKYSYYKSWLCDSN